MICVTRAVCVITPTAVLFRQILHLHISLPGSGMIHLSATLLRKCMFFISFFKINNWLVAIILKHVVHSVKQSLCSHLFKVTY